MLYISPLRALAVDVEKNLRAPLAGIGHAADRAERLGVACTSRRSASAPATRRPTSAASAHAHPPDILITTPESLYLMLTSQARETLRNVRWVIVDEIHALAATKRGAHLALSLERLEQLTRRAAAAHRPVGHAAAARGDRALPRRPDDRGTPAR